MELRVTLDGAGRKPGPQTFCWVELNRARSEGKLGSRFSTQSFPARMGPGGHPLQPHRTPGRELFSDLLYLKHSGDFSQFCCPTRACNSPHVPRVPIRVTTPPDTAGAPSSPHPPGAAGASLNLPSAQRCWCFLGPTTPPRDNCLPGGCHVLQISGHPQVLCASRNCYDSFLASAAPTPL